MYPDICDLTQLCGLCQLGVTWAIGATRVTNNKHHVADVVAGMFLGGMIATVFALRAIPRVRCAVPACVLCGTHNPYLPIAMLLKLHAW